MAGGYGRGKVMIGPSLVGHVAVIKVTAVPAVSPRIRFRSFLDPRAPSPLGRG